ncbi:glutathione peroxidase [Acuticoccus sp.]|uniref:glutathione peroxidase n=1 Tax=Acuticoccus sp. TaxID=1904378 RepID=UPI003B51C9FB
MTGFAAGSPATVLRVAALAAVASSLGIVLATKTLADRPRPIEWSAQELTDIEGHPFDASALDGRVVLLVNTASRCAFTPQYEGLEALHQRYEGTGLTVLAVPSNDFGGQEPGANASIAAFCTSAYGVSFPMLQKARVSGEGAHPLFAWARRSGGRAAIPAWNFHKILVGRDGRVVAGFPSHVSPRSPQVMGAVERALRTPAF